MNDFENFGRGQNGGRDGEPWANAGAQNPLELDLAGPPSPEAINRDLEHKNKLLMKWDRYFPHEPPKPFDVSFSISGKLNTN